MGLSSQTLRPRSRGFTIIEVLVVLAISSLMLVVLAFVFKSGLWQVSKSSGRIEVLRTGRQALNSVQRYLASAVQPSNLTLPNGTAVRDVIYTPNQIYDPYASDPSTNPAPSDRVRFYSPMDHINNGLMPGARQIQLNPTNFAYEIVVVPGVNNLGQDLVLRRMQAPTTANPYPLLPDVALRPRYLTRRLGLPDAGVPGGFRDGFVVQRWRDGAIQLRVNVSGSLISDDLNRTKTEGQAPVRVTMSTIYQPPIFNVQ